MTQSNEVLTGLIAVKELEILNLRDRINILQEEIDVLSEENQQLYAFIDKMEKVKVKNIGFKQKGNM